MVELETEDMETFRLLDAILTADLFAGGALKSPGDVEDGNFLVAALVPLDQYQTDQLSLKGKKVRISYLDRDNDTPVDAYENLQGGN